MKAFQLGRWEILRFLSSLPNGRNRFLLLRPSERNLNLKTTTKQKVRLIYIITINYVEYYRSKMLIRYELQVLVDVINFNGILFQIAEKVEGAW